jgi:hypothetical protein
VPRPPNNVTDAALAITSGHDSGTLMIQSGEWKAREVKSGGVL